MLDIPGNAPEESNMGIWDINYVKPSPKSSVISCCFAFDCVAANSVLFSSQKITPNAADRYLPH